MKPIAREQYKHSGSVIREIDMTINLAQAPHIMDVLTKQYSDPVGATIREYATNARDSHVEAGNPDPINITLPSAFNPTFVVEDKGTGMSYEDIEKVYSSYGYSTKQHSDELNGMLGIGSKCALAYADQFTIDAVKDGMRTVAVMTRGANGAGVIKVLSHESTSDSNGVRISVPVSDIERFNQKARRFFALWTSPVNVNGEDARDRTDYTDVGGGVSFRKSVNWNGAIRVVMGDVAYDAGHIVSGVDYIDMLIDVPIGSVEFAPSRESLMDTPHTRQFIDANQGAWRQAIMAEIAKAISDATTPWEAVLASREFSKYNVPLEYNGQTIPRGYNAITADGGWAYNSTAKRYKVSSGGGISTSTDHKWAVVENYSNADLSTAQALKAIQYVQQTDPDVNRLYVLKANGTRNYWTEGLPTFDYADVKAWRRPKSMTSAGRRSLGLKKCSQWGDTPTVELSDDEIDDLPDEHVVGPVRIDTDVYGQRAFFRALHKLMDEAEQPYVLIGANRVAKYLRENEDAVELSDYINEAVQTWGDSLTEWEKFSCVNEFRYVGLPTDTDDQFFNEVAEVLCGPENERATSLRKQADAIRTIRRYVSGIELPEITSDIHDEWMEKYPMVHRLLAYAGRYLADGDTEAIREYVNSVAG